MQVSVVSVTLSNAASLAISQIRSLVMWRETELESLPFYLIADTNMSAFT